MQIKRQPDLPVERQKSMSDKIGGDIAVFFLNLIAAHTVWQFFYARRNLERWAVKYAYRLILVKCYPLGGPFWVFCFQGAGVAYHVLLADNLGQVQYVWIFSPFPMAHKYKRIIVRWENNERSFFDIPD